MAKNGHWALHSGMNVPIVLTVAILPERDAFVWIFFSLYYLIGQSHKNDDPSQYSRTAIDQSGSTKDKETDSLKSISFWQYGDNQNNRHIHSGIQLENLCFLVKKNMLIKIFVLNI